MKFVYTYKTTYTIILLKIFIDIENVSSFSNHQNTWLSPYPSFQNAALIKSNISHRTIKLLFEDIAFFVVFNYRHHHDDFSKREMQQFI